MRDLKEIVVLRLEQLRLGAVEAATAAGIERTFIRDIVEDKKKSVRSDKLRDLARALRLNAEALSRGELVPEDEQEGLVSGEHAIKSLLRRIDKLPPGAIHPLYRTIMGYVEDAEQSEQTHSPAQTEPASRRPQSEPTR